MNHSASLLKKINKKEAILGIVGMGYVGSALADLTTAAGYITLGFVTRPEKAVKINNQEKKRLSATTDRSRYASCDVIFVCVQTPVYEDKTPDLRFLEMALRQIVPYMRPGQLIVIESSVSAGTTRQIALPILKESKLKEGTEFFLSFSPERVDPGNKKFKLFEIPKVVAGLEEESNKVVTALYSKIVKKVVSVSTLEAAELTKLFENTFRLVNISFVNEMADYAKALGVDIWEVIDAAQTKPFGFMAHYPGPGIGGHCIPVDPYYLLDDARKRSITLSILESSGRVNDEQPLKVVRRALEVLEYKEGESKKNHKILLIGLAYKPDIDDTRESAAFKVWEELQEYGFSVSFHDPYVARVNGFFSVDLTEKSLGEYDLVIILTNHSNLNYEMLRKTKTPILDTRNIFHGFKKKSIHPL